jgi:hypothetical protein
MARVGTNPAELQRLERAQQTKELELKSTRRDLAVLTSRAEVLTRTLEKETEALEDLKEKRKDCTSNCGTLDLQIRAKTQTVANAQADKDKVERALAEYERRVTELESDISSLSAKIAALQVGDPSIRQDSLQLQEDLLNFVTRFGFQEGGTLSILFRNRTMDLVKEYQKRNAKLSVVPMPVSAALHFFVKLPGDLRASASLSHDVAGLRPSLNELPVDGKDSSIMGASLSGQVKLTVIGTCNLLRSPSTASARARGNFDGIAAFLTPNVIYSYEVQTRRTYSARHNLAEVFKKIVKVKTKSGLFSSSSHRSVTDENESRDWFEFKSYTEDPDNAFPNENEFRQTIKAEILDRTLAQLARTYLPKEGSSNIPAAELPAPGAPAIADNLRGMKNKFAQAGAILLDLGHALCGSSSASDSFLRSVDIWTEEVVDELKMVTEFSSFSFVSEKGSL